MQDTGSREQGAGSREQGAVLGTIIIIIIIIIIITLFREPRGGLRTTSFRSRVVHRPRADELGGDVLL